MSYIRFIHLGSQESPRLDIPRETVTVVDRYMTSREVGVVLHLHANTIMRMAERGDLASVRVSRRGDRRYRESDVLSMLTRSH